MSRIDETGRPTTNRIRPRLRLWAFLVVIACVAFGLSKETDRRRRELREWEDRRLQGLQLVAEGRKQRAEEYRLRVLTLEEEERQQRDFIERRNQNSFSGVRSRPGGNIDHRTIN